MVSPQPAMHRQFLAERLLQHAQVSLRLFDGDAGLQTAEDVEQAIRTAQRAGEILIRLLNPKVNVRTERLVIRRRDADDDGTPLIEAQSSPRARRGGRRTAAATRRD